MVQFIHESDSSRAASALGARLIQELETGKRTVWMVCGGSNIPLIVSTMQSIPVELTGNLTVMLTDERYGKPGHPDSNWKQLYDAGFQPGKARVVETLQPELTLQDTCARYEKALHDTLEPADLVIAQFGIGGDGHIAGILPQSAGLNDEQWVAGYDAGTFKRITITPPVWQHIDIAYAFVYGSTKRTALEQLQHQELPVRDQPAQLLKTLPEVYVYTDQAA